MGTTAAGGGATKITSSDPSSSTSSSTSSSSPTIYNVAIIGGGITGTCAAYTLCRGLQQQQQQQQQAAGTNFHLNVHLFDQGQRGVGGRSSHRKIRLPQNDNDHGRSSTPAATTTTVPDSDTNIDNDDKKKKNEVELQWDHGCQFFRADTDRFKIFVNDWMKKGLVQEWKGTFVTSTSSSSSSSDNNGDNNNNKEDKEKEDDTQQYDFFGMPSQPPFYVGVGGMQNVTQGIINDLLDNNYPTVTTTAIANNTTTTNTTTLSVFTGTRVAHLEERRSIDQSSSSPLVNDNHHQWRLWGTSGAIAFHDTPETVVHHHQSQQSNETTCPIEIEGKGLSLLTMCNYDAVILTDVSSSSFGTWHRASAGVPESFAARVRDRVGARVPLFTAMIAFDTTSTTTTTTKTKIPFDAVTFYNHKILWFAAKTNSKPGMNTKKNDKDDDDVNDKRECWTLVSTPEYAMKKIEETPMQDAQTGVFIPQSPEYLTLVPGPDLKNAFCEELLSKDRFLSHTQQRNMNHNMPMDSTEVGTPLEHLPDIVYLNAQRWGSALPSHRHLARDLSSPTRKVLSGCPYDSGRGSLAPTTQHDLKQDDSTSPASFLVDEEIMLFQAGDMVSNLTPGFEGAALSGMDAATDLWDKLLMREETKKRGTDKD